MTPATFESECQKLCPYCKDGIPLRLRTDTNEWVHDGAIAIPGTLGRRHSHAFCLANNFRKENKDKVVG